MPDAVRHRHAMPRPADHARLRSGKRGSSAGTGCAARARGRPSKSAALQALLTAWQARLDGTESAHHDH